GFNIPSASSLIILRSRTLLRVEIEDAMAADRIFHMLMGSEVPPRKAFIQAHARNVRNLDI
ncbi:MAG TPA: hypothetical protein EYP71_03910, partial [Dehalococcoidia bacterium]|nr:hypothetical protein [Dehalococcoidia bacterium]